MSDDSPIVAAVSGWMLNQMKENGVEEDFDNFLERMEIVDQAGLLEAGMRVSWAAGIMMELNGVERGLAIHTVMCLLLGAHLAREKLL